MLHCFQVSDPQNCPTDQSNILTISSLWNNILENIKEWLMKDERKTDNPLSWNENAFIQKYPTTTYRPFPHRGMWSESTGNYISQAFLSISSALENRILQRTKEKFNIKNLEKADSGTLNNAKWSYRSLHMASYLFLVLGYANIVSILENSKRLGVILCRRHCDHPVWEYRAVYPCYSSYRWGLLSALQKNQVQ